MLRIIPRFLFLILCLTFGQQTLAHSVETKAPSAKYIVDEDTQTPDNMNDGEDGPEFSDPMQVVINT